eukprot:700745-Hanusia_phi.AAC.1
MLPLHRPLPGHPVGQARVRKALLRDIAVAVSLLEEDQLVVVVLPFVRCRHAVPILVLVEAQLTGGTDLALNFAIHSFATCPRATTEHAGGKRCLLCRAHGGQRALSLAVNARRLQ